MGSTCQMAAEYLSRRREKFCTSQIAGNKQTEACFKKTFITLFMTSTNGILPLSTFSFLYLSKSEPAPCFRGLPALIWIVFHQNPSSPHNEGIPRAEWLIEPFLVATVVHWLHHTISLSASLIPFSFPVLAFRSLTNFYHLVIFIPLGWSSPSLFISRYQSYLQNTHPLLRNQWMNFRTR